VGESKLGTKAEVKNLNSFRFLKQALEFEIERQIDLVSNGERVRQETRLWDAAAGRTVAMRSKEEAHDYRYFPEPDLPPLRVDAAEIARVRAELPELPDVRKRRLVTQYSLPEYDAGILTQSAALADYFEKTAAASGNAKASSNWIMGELARKMNATGDDITAVPIAPARLGELITLIDKGTINGSTAKEVFEKMYASKASAAEIVEKEGLSQVSDDNAIVEMIRTVLAANADAVTSYKVGKAASFGFLVGQVMKAAAGKANPKLVNALLKRELEG
jgi:aspartyl-tRNA(Asn)/glutamyl-tRNA(Gln) amidotransferase subunit B